MSGGENIGSGGENTGREKNSPAVGTVLQSIGNIHAGYRK
jgi:hypothetical protein